MARRACETWTWPLLWRADDARWHLLPKRLVLGQGAAGGQCGAGGDEGDAGEFERDPGAGAEEGGAKRDIDMVKGGGAKEDEGGECKEARKRQPDGRAEVSGPPAERGGGERCGEGEEGDEGGLDFAAAIEPAAVAGDLARPGGEVCLEVQGLVEAESENEEGGDGPEEAFARGAGAGAGAEEGDEAGGVGQGDEGFGAVGVEAVHGGGR